MKINYPNNQQKIVTKVKLIEKIVLLLLFFVSIASAQSNVEKYSLEDCIQIALQNNPGIRSSSYYVDESGLKIKEAKGGLYPNLNFNTSANRFYLEKQKSRLFYNVYIKHRIS